MKINRVLIMILAGLLFCAQAVHVSAAADQVKGLLSGIEIRESATPVRTDPNWRKPQRVVLLHDGGASELDPGVLSALRAAAGEAELVVVSDVAQAGEKMQTADVLLGSCRDASVEMSALRWVQNFSAGVENCSKMAVYRDKKIMLTNMKGIYGPGIAEHVIAMMLSLTRGLHQFHKKQALGEWDRALGRSYPMQEVSGKTMLIVGLGGIGSEIAWRASALGMRVIATRNSSREKPDFVDYVGLADELLTLAAGADVIVNATPLTSSTQGLFDSRFFDSLRPSAYFINVGRGKSVVTGDLVAALKNGKLAGAALDVADPEPLPPDHVLWHMPNVIITPHISANSDRIMDRFWAFVGENLRRYVNGEPMLNVVNIQKGY